MVVSIASLALKSVLVFAFGAFAAFLVRRSSASRRHCVWAATFAVALALPAVGAFGPAWSVPLLPSPVASTPAVGALAEAPERPVAVAVGTPAASRLEIGDWLLALWAAGALLVGVRWVRGYVRASGIIRRSRPLDTAMWRARTRAAARAAGLSGHVQVRVSDTLSVPVAWGWTTPTVVLPPKAEAWDADRVHAVLLHEMAHLRRRDAWTQAAAQATLVLHWPNPLAWAAYGRLRFSREQACDDAALQSGTSSPEYAAHLVAAARELCPARPAPAVLAALVAPDELESRVRAVLDGQRQRSRTGSWTALATMVTAVAIGAPLAMLQPVAGPRPAEAQAAPLAVAGGMIDVRIPADVVTAPRPSAGVIAHVRGGAPGHGAADPARTVAVADPQDARRDTIDSAEARREAAAVERAAAAVEREAAAVERAAADVEREAAAVERDAAAVERGAAAVERAAAAVERDAAIVERDAAAVERAAAYVERDADAVGRANAAVERQAAAIEREAAAAERTAAAVEREAAAAERELARIRRALAPQPPAAVRRPIPPDN
ncbi:MAG: M56 family metallopeptidase [Bacteroidota bacterium]